jgi:ubiquitin-conjugating enzyme E2 W
LNSDLKSWTVTLVGVNQTTYEGESYRLKFIFPADYPMRPPIVYFLKPIPRHEHVYSNGDICLNLLGKDWQPTMTAQGLAVSILSMLSSAKEKKTPPDNAMRKSCSPLLTHFIFCDRLGHLPWSATGELALP